MLKTEAVGVSYYYDTLSKTEEILTESGVDHRFVGGVITNSIDLATIVILNSGSRKIVLESPRQTSVIREDGSISDMDIIGFSRDKDTYKEAERKLAEEARKAKQKKLPYPTRSIEATHYPNWRARFRLLQFVSTFDVDNQGELSLNFGKVHQPIPDETIAPWEINLADGLRLTSINPVGLLKCYYLRNAAGLKKKDTEPIVAVSEVSYSKIDMLAKVADIVIEQGLLQGEDYRQIFASWDQYIDNLLNHPDGVTAFKGWGTKIFWDRFGKGLAHGPLAPLANKFTG